METRHRGWQDRVAQRGLAGEHVISRMVAALAIDAEAGEALPCGSRSRINTGSPIAASAVPEVDRRRGLADAALLVGDRQDTRVPRRLAGDGFDTVFRAARAGLQGKSAIGFQAFSVGLRLRTIRHATRWIGDARTLWSPRHSNV